MARPEGQCSAKLDVDRLNSLLAGCDLAKHIIYRSDTGSTNDDAIAAAREGAPEGNLFLTDFQTGGRGTRGRSWHAPRNGALLLSSVLRPEPGIGPPALTRIAGLALCGGLRSSTDLEVKIKWPNDAVINGKKIGGVLVETIGTRPSAAIVGIGANLNFSAAEIDAGDTPVTTVLDETGRSCDREGVIAAVVIAIARHYRAIRAGDSLLSEWRELSAILGGWVTLTTDHESFRGTAVGFGTDGGLVLALEDGSRREFQSGRVIDWQAIA